VGEEIATVAVGLAGPVGETIAMAVSVGSAAVLVGMGVGVCPTLTWNVQAVNERVKRRIRSLVVFMLPPDRIGVHYILNSLCPEDVPGASWNCNETGSPTSLSRYLR
jgi:hypothetical protein